MRKCLYCREENPAGESECRHCGMALPLHADGAPERRQRRFLWFCVALTLFCVAMFFWLPRDIG